MSVDEKTLEKEPHGIRIIFDKNNKKQYHDYLLYYHRSTLEYHRSFSAIEKTIIALLLMGWGREKISKRSKGKIKVCMVKKICQELPCLSKLSHIMRKAKSKEDALDRAFVALDIHGSIESIEY